MTNIITKLSDNLLLNIKSADEIWVAVALMNLDGLNFLTGNIKLSCRQNYLVGVDLPTDPKALNKLNELQLKSDINVRLHTDKEYFHPKLYLIRKNNNYSAFVGSANCTNGGLFKNIELTVCINDQTTCKQIKDWYEGLYNVAKPLTKEFITKYQVDYTKRQKRKREDEHLAKKEKQELNETIEIQISEDNTITFQKRKGKSWIEYGKITLPAKFNPKLDSKYKLEVRHSIEVSILIPNRASISCYLYHRKNNNTLYYQFQIPKSNRTHFIKYIANKKDFNFEFDLNKKEIKIK